MPLNVIYTIIWMLTENNLYIIVISVVITVKYCKSTVLLYSPLNSYLYVHWILDCKVNIMLSVIYIRVKYFLHV